MIHPKDIMRQTSLRSRRYLQNNKRWVTQVNFPGPFAWTKRYFFSEDTPRNHRNYAMTGHWEGEGNEMWGSIADNIKLMMNTDYWQIPFTYQGPREKQNVAPIRISVLTEVNSNRFAGFTCQKHVKSPSIEEHGMNINQGPFASYDDLPRFAIKLLPPPSGKLNAMAARVSSPDVSTKMVPEGSFL